MEKNWGDTPSETLRRLYTTMNIFLDIEEITANLIKLLIFCLTSAYKFLTYYAYTGSKTEKSLKKCQLVL